MKDIREVTTSTALKRHLAEFLPIYGYGRTLCGAPRVTSIENWNNWHRGPRQAKRKLEDLPLCSRCHKERK